MIPDLDIYRSTNVLIHEHREDAAMEAAIQGWTKRLVAGLFSSAEAPMLVRA